MGGGVVIVDVDVCCCLKSIVDRVLDFDTNKTLGFKKFAQIKAQGG